MKKSSELIGWLNADQLVLHIRKVKVIKMKYFKEKHISVVKYETYSEFMGALRAPRIGGRDNSSEDSGFSFTETRSYEAAERLMIGGYQEGYDKMKSTKAEVEKFFVSQDESKAKPMNDVIGYAPIVPHAILGIPQSMINTHKEPNKQRVIELYFNSSIPAFTDAEEILEFGSILLGVVDHLERQNYRIAINVGMLARSGESTTGYMYSMKGAGEPLNHKRAAYFLGHPSFLRRTGFKIFENEEKIKDVTHKGYGSYNLKSTAKQKIMDHFSPKGVYLNSGEIFKNADSLEAKIKALKEAILE